MSKKDKARYKTIKRHISVGGLVWFSVVNSPDAYLGVIDAVRARTIDGRVEAVCDAKLREIDHTVTDIPTSMLDPAMPGSGFDWSLPLPCDKDALRSLPSTCSAYETLWQYLNE